MQTVDPREIERFSRIADEWWDESGKFAPLHAINPLRIGYIRDHVVKHFGRDAAVPAPLAGLTLIDIGCGGGLICEPMARLGAQVTGIDASEKNIAVASLHAKDSGVAVDYRCTAAEDMRETFDIVLALEVVEHVANPAGFVAECLRLCKPGGLVFFSTLNRTPKAFALAIIGAEVVLRWLPRGTHTYKKFLKPSELAAFVRAGGGEVAELMGMTMNPLTFKWSLNAKDLGVNYLMVVNSRS